MDNSSIRRNAIALTKEKYDSYLLFSVLTVALGTLLSIFPVPMLGSLLKPVLDLNVYGVFSRESYEKVKKGDFLDNYKSNWHNAFSYSVRVLIYTLLPVIIIAAGAFVLVSINTSIGLNHWDIARDMNVLSSIVTVCAYIACIAVYIYRSYSAKMGSYIIFREPEISSKDALAKSIELMKGRKFNLFVLNLYLIPEYIQNIFLFYGQPKINMAYTLFFEGVYNYRASAAPTTPSNGSGRFCPNCGTPIPEDSSFCPNCGNKVN